MSKFTFVLRFLTSISNVYIFYQSSDDTFSTTNNDDSDNSQDQTLIQTISML